MNVPSRSASVPTAQVRRLRPRVRHVVHALTAVSLLTIAIGSADSASSDAIPIKENSFKCLKAMVTVRHFFVDNLLGNRQATVEVAKKGTGIYPAGSVVQLIPGEVMVKQPKGFNPATKDWEFFELDVSKEGSKIRRRGFVDVNNRFGGNCFACHIKAREEFDLVCEIDHGCDAIPITRRMLAALQKTDPRCKKAETLTEDDKKALQELDDVLKTMMAPAGPKKE